MEKFVLIDGNSIMNRAFYGIMGSKMLTTKDGKYTNAIYGFLAILFKLIEDVKPEYMAVAFDLKAPTARHKMYEGYKANRKGMPDELAEQMPIIKEILRAMNIDIIEKEYRNFARQEMQKYFEKVIEVFYPIIRKYNKPKPILKIRKMKTCWGTSNPEQNVITLNEYLYSASPYCIKYVVLHELTHFLYTNHDKQFFDFISIHMPDWQERKNKLNTDFNV